MAATAALVLVLAIGPGQAAGIVLSATDRGTPVQVWQTTANLSAALSRRPDLAFNLNSALAPTVFDVDEHIEYQRMDGFGAAVTDTSAWLLYNKLSSSTRTRLMQALFDPTSGIGIGWIRIPMGSSDYTHDHYYSYDDNDGLPDPDLQHFSVGHDLPYVVPILRQALGINSELKFDANPWSPPGWMKSNHSMINGGRLHPQYYGALAAYFVRFVQAYQALGIPIYALQPQNEPLAVTTYPSMYWPAADEATFIARDLGPALARAGLHAKILGYDHNWSRPEYPDALLKTSAFAYLAGTAWHSYSGIASAMGALHAQFPSKDIYETESSVAHPADLFVNAVQNWSKTGVMWNVALDTDGGPLPNNVGCRGCIGLVKINQKTGAYSFTGYYYEIGHFSKFVRAGAYHIAATLRGGTGAEGVAFRNPDGTKVLVAYNPTARGHSFDVRWGDSSFRYTLPAGATVTFSWRGTQRAPRPAPTRDPALSTIAGRPLNYDRRTS